MKVLHLTERAGDGGGVESHLAGVVPALAAAGHPQHVVVEAGTLPPGATGTVLPGVFRHPASLEAIAAVRAEAARFEPDVVLVHAVDSAGIVAALAGDWPVALYLHDYRVACPGNLRFLRFERRTCERRVGLACLASAYLHGCNGRRPSTLLSSLGRTRQWLRLLPRLRLVLAGCERTRQVFAAEAGAAVRCEILAPAVRLPDAPYPPGEAGEILFVGRLTEAKGPDILLEALATLKRPWRLTLAGHGPMTGRLETMARRAGVASRVRLTGWLGPDDLEACYRRASIVVVPSVWEETFCLVGIEALARGRCVVGSRIGGIPDWLDHGRTGMLVTPAVPEELASCLAGLLDDPARVRAMGADGPLAIRGRFGVAEHVARLLELLESAARAPAG